ncbi:MAG: hypothetical protein K0S09_785 [Sphingobacteriaceae bacterium]|jgi:hypothetical protein|nr:hypothetical protein [Sphingobacteriaceae bacterium]
MKAILIICIIATGFTAKAQSVEVQQLLLNYEKLTQLKNILTDMKKGYEIVSKGYTAIKNISEGNFNLHNAFISGLLAVNPAIKNYKRVPDIINHQKNIVKEYRQAFNQFKNSGTFSSSEIDYLGNVYTNLFNQSLQNLDELATVITASKLSMSDDERLEAIDRIFADTEDKLQFLRDFNRKTNILVIQRTREKQDIATSKKLYQVNQ